MKIKITALSSLLFLTAFTSCTSFLTPAILGNNMGYIPKAMGADSVKTLTNLSASYAGSASPSAGTGFELGMANISQSHTFKKANISYGIFGYAGKASGGDQDSNTEDSKNYLPPFKKSISGIGLRFSTGLHNTSANGNTDFRYINFENALSFEGGAYTKFRQQVYSNRIPDYVAVTNRKVLWTTGLSTEVIWRVRDNHDIRHAFRLFIGGTPNFANSFRSGTKTNDLIRGKNSMGWVFSYFLYIKHFSLSLEMADNVNYAQKISVGYSFQ
ncbi:hypothetical protein H9N25_09205 [Pedobacter riviphilus]|uniref:Outer membrane protein beta-barrel domain-containing protein n=1 Tax=Pedobacter riviphilus TaxID=2766984 RepID=A0ABX6TP94_9SPHI|nr:hypothetical protein [Pedobacter riviphilus]QNR86547.1 hypothetical protein H9N25_09205 [Pedobacter riviphilus]